MRIGYASQAPRSHYWLLVNHGVRTRANELGAELTILPASTLDEQIAAMNTLIDQRVDVLLLGPIQATGLGSTVARARSAGIPVVVLASGLRNGVVDCTVQADHRHGAELAAAYVVEQLGGCGMVAHIKEVALVTRDTLIETALEIVTVLPGVLQDTIERGVALARQQIILNQQAALRELSTPLIPLSDAVMLMPLIGTIDALRQLTERYRQHAATPLGRELTLQRAQ